MQHDPHKLLSDLGVLPHLKGHLFLTEAIALYTQDPDLAQQMEDIYLPIAGFHSTTVAYVEKAIRHSISIAGLQNVSQFAYFMSRHNVQDLAELSNEQFIVLVGNYCLGGYGGTAVGISQPILQ